MARRRRAEAAEIGFTVVSLTASLLAVFIPLLFMGGLVGRMFREFAITLSIAVVVSMVVSLTLTPMMCAKLLRHRAAASSTGGPPPPRPRRRGARRGAGAGLRVLVGVGAPAPALTLLATLATVAATIHLYLAMPKSFLPAQDTGLISVALRPRLTLPSRR